MIGSVERKYRKKEKQPFELFLIEGCFSYVIIESLCIVFPLGFGNLKILAVIIIFLCY